MAAAKRNNPTDDAGPVEVLAELDKRVRGLEDRERALLSEQLALEADGVFPVPATGVSAPKADALAMLERGEIVELSHRPEHRLFEIIRERATIKDALHLAGQRGFRLRVSAEAELAGDIHERWTANISKTVKLVRMMREMAAERARLRNEYSSRTGLPLQDAAGIQADRLIGEYKNADAAQAFLDTAVKAGIEG